MKKYYWFVSGSTDLVRELTEQEYNRMSLKELRPTPQPKMLVVVWKSAISIRKGQNHLYVSIGQLSKIFPELAKQLFEAEKVGVGETSKKVEVVNQ